MFDSNKKLNAFYDECVRLRGKSKTLIEYRDKNVERVREGTKILRKDNPDGHFPMFVDEFSQGSMAMHTINEAQNDDDQDIDHALVYDEEDATESPSAMKEFVLNAVVATGGNFKTEPEVQKSAVTIWYEENYHVDLAIYKRRTDILGQATYYHAGETWQKRDPKAINDWFQKEKTRLSPTSTPLNHVTVREDQVRRIVRLLKFWANSRSDWSLPSGLILSVLAIEQFSPHDTRDDVSFINTLKAIKARLNRNTDVRNPTDLSLSLTSSEKTEKQVRSLQEKLEKWLPELEASLSQNLCTEIQAAKSWSTFFRNEWWAAELKKNENSIDALSSSQLKVDVTFKRLKGGRVQRYIPNGRQTIPVRHGIRFTLAAINPPPDRVEWIVQNSGDEAAWAKQLEAREGYVDSQNHNVCNEQSAYRGNHTMICRVTSGGRLREVRIPVRIRR